MPYKIPVKQKQHKNYEDAFYSQMAAASPNTAIEIEQIRPFLTFARILPKICQNKDWVLGKLGIIG